MLGTINEVENWESGREPIEAPTWELLVIFAEEHLNGRDTTMQLLEKRRKNRWLASHAAAPQSFVMSAELLAAVVVRDIPISDAVRESLTSNIDKVR